MIDKILVPLDGSPSSRRILGTVRWLAARRPEAEVMLLGVVTPEAVHEGGDRIQLSCDHLDHERRQLIEAGAMNVRYDLMSGDAPRSILTFAQTYRPSLIAMTTHGREGIDRMLRGSVTEEVLRRSPFPVLACNSRGLETAEASRGITKILVPLDGSSRSATIVPFAAALARTWNATVTILHVAYPAALEIEYGVGLAHLKDAAAEILEPELERFRGVGVLARILTVLGAPGPTILDLAEADRYDLVAMATHGRSGVTRFLLGSVTEEVLRRCRAPLLVQRSVVVPSSAPVPVTQGA